jgi:hypothetical protein
MEASMQRSHLIIATASVLLCSSGIVAAQSRNQPSVNSFNAGTFSTRNGIQSPANSPKLNSSTAKSFNNLSALRDRNSLGDLSTVDAMRLQQAMDKKSKMMETLSNAMKRSSDTSNGIVRNLK